MRDSYQTEQAKPIDQAHRLYSNIIKITQSGYESIGDIAQWTAFKKQAHKNVCTKYQNKSTFAHRQNTQCENNELKKQQKTRSINKTVSRKTLRAHHKWTRSQQTISENIQKQLQKRQVQKMKQFEWLRVSSNCRTNISGILDKWNNSMADQKDRLKNRLKQIHSRKYKNKEKENKINGQTEKKLFFKHFNNSTLVRSNSKQI